MKMRYSIASLPAIATLLAGCAATLWGQSKPTAPPAGITIPPSSVAKPGDAGLKAHTSLEFLGSGALSAAAPQLFSGTPQYYGPPFPGYFYETPASLACIYNLVPQTPGCNPYEATPTNPSGGKKAIAIVDAFDDPYAFSDLQNFSGQFGIVGINPSSFIVVYAPYGGITPGSCIGGVLGPAPQPPPAAGTGWDIEESLDVQMAHSMAPFATLYLVEAQSNYLTDLNCAVSVANYLVSKLNGGGEISMSWGSGEYPGETASDALFTAPNVVYFAAAGDGPGVIYPSASPNVVSVGGTTLSTNAVNGNFLSENTWQDGGGGTSIFEPRPSYQDGIAAIVGTQRGTPDISADANPSTGVWVLDSDYFFGFPVWFVVGGTSVASPMMAGIVNAAGSFSNSSHGELTKLYSATHGITDLTAGNCGEYVSNFATTGWDFCTGLGSPKTYAQK